MNRAEERLRAAARTAADMFPKGGDLPPLHLAERTRGRRPDGGSASRAPANGTRRVWAWVAPAAAAAAVIAVISVLAVPHQIASNAAHRQHALHRRTAPSSPARNEQRKLDALIAEWVAPATGLQYDHGGKLVWMVRARELRVTARCMAMKGYHISDKTAPYNMADFADNTQMPDLPRIARTHEFVPLTGYKPTSYPAAEQKAFLACQSAADSIYAPLLRTSMSNAWWNIIFRAQASKQVKAAIPALNACAARYGFPNGAYGRTYPPIKTFADFMDWIAGFLDGAGSRGASGSTMKTLERHWTTNFVTCATPIVGTWQRMLLKAQPGFLHKHAQQLARLDRLAAQELLKRS